MAVAAIHPGEHLAEELETLGMSAAELARNLHVPTNRVTQILNGQRAITGDTALRLAHFFGTSAEFWLNLQNLYELRLAEQRAGKAIQALPTRKRSKAIPGKAFGFEALAHAIRAAKRYAGEQTDLDQGKEVSRGDRRTR
jgi:addiction module HigA family antidote